MENSLLYIETNSIRNIRSCKTMLKLDGALGQLVSEVLPCKVNADTLHCGDTQRRHWAVRIILQPSGQL